MGTLTEVQIPVIGTIVLFNSSSGTGGAGSTQVGIVVGVTDTVTPQQALNLRVLNGGNTTDYYVAGAAYGAAAGQWLWPSPITDTVINE